MPRRVAPPAPPRAEGELVRLDGELCYRIRNHDAMPPFLMTVVSPADHWMFVSSNGALTAGRRDPDHALFPYGTDDRIHDSLDLVGGTTLVRVGRDPEAVLWEPLSARCPEPFRVTRSLAKSVYGNRLVFEEINHDLHLAFSVAWMTSERFGFVRRCHLENLSGEPIELEILDGLQNLLPAGLSSDFQLQLSTLADAYKEAELDISIGLALYRLSSIPTDRNEPNEALRATTVWSEGLDAGLHLLCAAQLGRFRAGLPVEGETRVRGRRGAYLAGARLAIAARSRCAWSTVADVDRDAADVAALVRLLASGVDLREELDADVRRGTESLIDIVSRGDGLQLTADELSCWRHFSNALFNLMRGGVPDDGYRVSGADFRAFVRSASARVVARQACFLDGLPESLPHRRLVELAGERGDTDLERLAREYLPLTFSRRHGDPSRPWNRFSIELRAPDGTRRLGYEGNWRDLFQNWEALALSHPGYVESMIFTFLDASTADGHNPYRVTRGGFGWEVPDAGSAWAHIGYWGDHQVVYLLRLLELSARYHPRALPALLDRRLFTYADVPYRIRPHAEMLRDPFTTIDFDADLDRRIRERSAASGGDGRLLPSADGTPQTASLAEKLLVTALARLFVYVPEGGLWMNTQRPEWNDANNALVGRGLSVVTLCHLRRFLAFCRTLFAGAVSDSVAVAVEVATALRRVAATLERHAGLLGAPLTDGDRRRILDELGAAGSDYRAALYAGGFSGDRSAIGAAELDRFCSAALRHLDHAIRANRRPDGLYHAYNLMRLTPDGIGIGRLPEMLEGQVAVLSSGTLGAAECADLLQALRRSPLYREDQSSYLLYPDRRLPGFFARNVLPAEAAARSPLLLAMIESGDTRIVVRDVNGQLHFDADLRNASVLARRLGEIGVPAEEVERILDLYESVFDHRSFTGRSGSFYKYEGLGCIYWHMVSKLLVAVQEVLGGAASAGADETVRMRLRRHYAEIREGIGVHKPPELYGAIPIDPYSHTPGFAGAQQPGMSGQVKEDLITRLGEMGARVEDGSLGFHPELAARHEFLGAPRVFDHRDVDGARGEIALGIGTLGFTICQVPVVAHRSGPPRIEITFRAGERRVIPGLRLDPATSAAIFDRTGAVRRLDLHWGFPAAGG